ncbi:MAG: phosphatidylserine decarboxylase [Bdellovibrionales bacterium]|nr:phosphatidylserine decarboxylase [Bdellovibrionales bacterium]
MDYIRVLPKNLLSQAIGSLVSIEHPESLARKARDWFIKRYQINMAEAELPLESYPSISKLFTRKLKPGIRPIGDGIVHPCDAFLSCADEIDYDTLIQAKGKKYSLSKLLANDKAPQIYTGGSHLVYYLCPTDYHRVHSPVDGEVTKVTHVPGKLWPVNVWSVQNIDELFSVNERVIFHIETALGPVELVMVGATNVGKITVSFDEEIVSNRVGQSHVPFVKSYLKPIKVSKGDELGVFNMGSTVVMIYPHGMLSVLPRLHKVKLGESV